MRRRVLGEDERGGLSMAGGHSRAHKSTLSPAEVSRPLKGKVDEDLKRLICPAQGWASKYSSVQVQANPSQAQVPGHASTLTSGTDTECWMKTSYSSGTVT